MLTIREITEMCKVGKVQDAYELAKKDIAALPNDQWVQKALGWALYYMIKCDTEEGNYEKLLEHIDELKSLNHLTVDNDCMLFDNVQLKIAEFIKKHVSLNDINYSDKLSVFFLKLKDYNFNVSKGHSRLLQSYIKFDVWLEMADFLDWWNLDNLGQEDYVPNVIQGKKIMTLAERAFIVNSKALLKLNDTDRIKSFLPKLEVPMRQHKEMIYLGYYYGKLLMALGSDMDEALKVIIPFAREKITEFWVWQLLGDVFRDDEEKQLACLLRAVHCRTQETFLGKVRIKLVALYIKREQFNYARYHIDAVISCYTSQRWKIPYEIYNYTHEPWFKTVVPDGNDPINYRAITDDILCDGAKECIAVVTYVDKKSHKSSMIYGYEQKMFQKLEFEVAVGNILKLQYIINKTDQIKVLRSSRAQLPNFLNYAKYIQGTIDKRKDKDFAILKSGPIRCFVSPTLVKKYNLDNGDNVRSLIVYDYDKKKRLWNWVCVNVKKL